MLGTTRAKRLDRHFDEWKRQSGRKQIRAAEKRNVESRVWTTTLFDFLFRLRVRANYREVASFLTWAVGEDWQSDFLQSLVRVTDLTTLLLDSLVVQQVGPDVYGSALDQFLEHDIADLPKPARFLIRRRAWLLG
jgi:hypothetical protein